MPVTSSQVVRILHVDDKPGFTEVTAEMLEREYDRFTVETATSASEGLDRLAGRDFDCLVSDYDMPGQNGIEFLEAVREEHPDLPFILYTGEGSEEVASEAISAGVTDYLRKEVGTSQYTVLAHRIEKAVESYRSQRAVEETDVTDRRERATKLERYETIVEALGDPVYVLDADGCYTFVNDAYLETTNYARDEIIGEHVSKVVPEEHRQRGGEVIRELLGDDTRQSATWELERITADGNRIPVENHVALMPTDNDEFRGTAGVLRDISERREREEELRQQNERLDKFASVVSHDLRNPLNVAQGRVNLAREECDSEHLEDAAEAVDRSLALIDDLLTLAREGQAVSEVEPVEIAAHVDDCWLTVETADATLVIETERTIQAHPGRLKRLLENLFRNAIEHGDESVTVTVGDLEDGFYVGDDGPGIPEGEREQVFDAGYSTAESGTGFGLNIVREIAEVHGWEIRVTDSEAGGARFEITGVDVVSAGGYSGD